ncbi:hypothetical protein EH802P2_00100 [Enterococcus phage EH802P2]|nr:hypothetical protein EH93P1_00095 [Enterococcus phage EH93P1]WAX15935.1 hypothetical protein EH93P2_00053 [Enterococcus phage EH93P2]WAX16205.1 hypothetical protein EH802P2_00100 [Enterococcus phage EH802P2]
MIEYKTFSRYSEDIPHGEKYIIHDEGVYHAFNTLYGVTFCKSFTSYEKANEHLNTIK